MNSIHQVFSLFAWGRRGHKWYSREVGIVCWTIAALFIVGCGKPGVAPQRQRMARSGLIEQPLPSSGSLNRLVTADAIAPLKIKSTAGSHYLVKMVDVQSGEPVLTVFVRGGDTVDLDVPLGTYEIRYAAGTSWYGEKSLFGPDTSYHKAAKTFTFEVIGNQINGFELTLYKVVHGNLKTVKLNAVDF